MRTREFLLATLVASLLLAGCDSKQPGAPGNPLPPQKPPAPKVAQ
ncbi:MAG: hypothetical protein JWP36_2487 [Paucimonas sp.]|nr:hypothetical protein [Paucimonas sp.]